MKRNPSFTLRVLLAIGDIVAIVVALGLAYFVRTHIDPRPFFFYADIREFVLTAFYLIPIWLMVLLVSGLYQESVYTHRSREYGRLLVASAVGMMALIAFEFFTDIDVFPVRIVAILAFLFCFVLLVIVREIIKTIRRQFLRHGKGVLNLVIVGNSDNTTVLAKTLRNNLASGYRVVGIVAHKKHIPSFAMKLQYSSLKLACEKTQPDAIIQTDDSDSDKIFNTAVNQHLSYGLIPTHEVLLSHLGEMKIIGAQPIINVGATPLVGGWRLVKRVCDIVFGFIFLLIASPLMLIIAIISKLSDPRGQVFYREKRLTRFGKKRSIYKFRTHKSAYSGLTPEQAFRKMGRPELVKTYRENGDSLPNDPRVTGVGKFLRATSLDELPQLVNVVKGDISLVGPRALQPGELAKYPNKNLILSAKSGLTGLAQVSGRRNISFEERRLLDIYYIQNWSLLMDAQIILRTILSVLLRRGAK